MFDATSPCEPAAVSGEIDPCSSGAVWLSFAGRGEHTRLARLYQKAPLRALFPRSRAEGLPVAVVANVGGGLVAGDRTRVEIEVGSGASALVTSQAAEKVYRSTGLDTGVETALTVASGGWLEWCPQETILFDRARLRRSLTVDLATDARILLGEILVLGRLASGERTSRGLLFDRIELRRDGELMWQDRLRLEGEFTPVLDAPAGLDGARAVATLVHAGPDAADWLDLVRGLADQPGVRAGATAVNGLLLIRILAADPLALRRTFALFWTRLREAAAGLPPVLPRLWHV